MSDARPSALEVVHRLPGRLRFRVCGAPVDRRLFDHLGDWLARTGEPFELSFNPKSGRFLLCWDRQAPLYDTLAAALDAFAAGVAGPAVEDALVRRHPDEPQRGPGSALALIAPEVARYLLARWLTPPPLRPLMATMRAAPVVAAGLGDLWRGEASVALLDAAAVGSCLALGDYPTASSIAFLLELGERLSEWTRERTRKSLAALFLGQEEPAWVRRDGGEARLRQAELREGDEVVIRAGSRIPVDGVVLEGEALVNLSSMTGEALARRRGQGHLVYAGTVVEEGRLVVEARSVGAHTRLAAIARLLDRADASRADVTGEAERLARRAVPYTFALSGLVLLASGSLSRAASVLVVDYSCALKLAAPLAIKAAMTEASTRGALVKGGRHLEALARADVYVFDKTGTLTDARPRVAGVYPQPGFERDYVLRNAACLEEHFPHPIATAIVQQAHDEGLVHEERHAEVEYVLAHGIASALEGERLLVGSRHFVADDEGVDVSGAATDVAACAALGQSLLYFAVGGRLGGVIAIDDPVRPDAARLVAALRRLGVARIVLLTGDGTEAAKAAAAKLGITEVFAEQLPDDKTALVERLRAEAHVVAMVGDGMNDSAALAQADVGIAMSHGADIAREAGGVLLLDGELGALYDGATIARRAMMRVRGGFRTTLAANSILLGLGLFGLAPAGLLALLHNAATVAICTWSVRPYLDTGK